jgi:hypothetical protein
MRTALVMLSVSMLGGPALAQVRDQGIQPREPAAVIVVEPLAQVIAPGLPMRGQVRGQVREQVTAPTAGTPADQVRAPN